MSLLQLSLLLFSVNVTSSIHLHSVSHKLAHNQHKPTNKTKYSLFHIPSLLSSMEAPSKAFLLFFLLPDWLKLNRLKSRMECGFSDIFSRYICSTVAKTIGVTIYTAGFGMKKCSEIHI